MDSTKLGHGWWNRKKADIACSKQKSKVTKVFQNFYWNSKISLRPFFGPGQERRLDGYLLNLATPHPKDEGGNCQKNVIVSFSFIKLVNKCKNKKKLKLNSFSKEVLGNPPTFSVGSKVLRVLIQNRSHHRTNLNTVEVA